MLCDREHCPTFTIEQLEECKTCNWVSQPPRFCGNFGLYLFANTPGDLAHMQYTESPMRVKREQLQAKKRKATPTPRPPSRTPEELARVQAICEACEFRVEHPRVGFRCSKSCSFCMSLKSRQAIGVCPEKKWPERK